MSRFLLQYLRPVLAVSFLVAAVRAAFPERSFGKLIGFAGSLLILAAILKPVAKLDSDLIAAAISRLEVYKVEEKLDLVIDNSAIISEIIKEKTETYISDKATQLELTLRSVSVTVEKGGEYPYPAAVRISGQFTQQQRTELTKWIERNLAIPNKAQTWVME